MRRLPTLTALSKLSPEVIASLSEEEILGKEIMEDLDLKGSEKNSKKDLLKDLLGAGKGIKEDLTTAASLGGNLMQMTANLGEEEPNVFRSTAGGALSGLASGGPLGAVLGGLGGYISGNKQLEGHLLNKDNMRKQNIVSKTVSPTIYRKGGKIKFKYQDGGIAEKQAVQTEEGEALLLPDSLELAKVFARKKHSEMDDKQVTDILKVGTQVFSKDSTFKPKTIEDTLIGNGSSFYSENETLFQDEVKIGDIFGTKEISFADAALKLRNKIQVVKDTNDIFDDITNTENKINRMAYLRELINLQKKSKGVPVQDEEPMQFKTGGVIRPLQIAEQFLQNNFDLPGLVSYDEDNNPTFIEENLNVLRDPFTGDYSQSDFTLDQARGQAQQKFQSDFGDSFFKRGYFGYGGKYYPTKPYTGEGYEKADEIALSQYIGGRKGQKQNFMNSPSMAEEAFGPLYNRLGDLREQSEESYQQGLADLDNLAKRTKGNLGMSAAAGTLGVLLQDPNVEPVIKDNAFINEMFRSSPLSLVESQASALRGQTQGLAQAMIQGGVDPKNIPALLAGSQSRSLAAESQLRLGVIKERRSDERNKYAALRQNRVDNLRSVVAAENQTKANKNQMAAKGMANIQDYLAGLRELEVSKMKEESRLRGVRDTSDEALFQTETNLRGSELGFDIEQKRIDDANRRAQEALDKLDNQGRSDILVPDRVTEDPVDMPLEQVQPADEMDAVEGLLDNAEEMNVSEVGNSVDNPDRVESPGEYLFNSTRQVPGMGEELTTGVRGREIWKDKDNRRPVVDRNASKQDMGSPGDQYDEDGNYIFNIYDELGVESPEDMTAREARTVREIPVTDNTDITLENLEAEPMEESVEEPITQQLMKTTTKVVGEEIVSEAGDPWEYKKVGDTYQAKRKNSETWRDVDPNTKSGKAVADKFGDKVDKPKDIGKAPQDGTLLLTEKGKKARLEEEKALKEQKELENTLMGLGGGTANKEKDGTVDWSREDNFSQLSDTTKVKSISVRQNNPLNITDKTYNADNIAGEESPIDGDAPITGFATVEDGLAATYQKFKDIEDGKSSNYNYGQSIDTFNGKWATSKDAPKLFKSIAKSMFGVNLKGTETVKDTIELIGGLDNFIRIMAKKENHKLYKEMDEAGYYNKVTSSNYEEIINRSK